MAYLEFEFPVRSWTSNEREILIAKLSTIGFEGFAEDENLVQAYIGEEEYSGDELNMLSDELLKAGLRIQYRFHLSPDKNWNEEWERKFSPVLIGEKVLIRAPFHASDADLPCTLVIEPKMSFGTGHHHTTRLMIEGMLDMELEGKRVLDMGCGTGVLGIYACYRKASRVLGVDIDQWAYENALENVARNAAECMEVKLGDAGILESEIFDVVLANITRNTLVRDIPAYMEHLCPGGWMLLSGILSEDVQFVLNAAYQAGLDHRSTRESANWLSLSFVKS